MRECVDLVEQGVIEPEALDTCVSWGIGYKLAVVGPMALARYGRPRHLPGGELLPEQGALHPHRHRRLRHREDQARASSA